MREIKFRAWDKENKIMVGVDLIGEHVLKITDGEWESIDDFEVMQFTSLKDKNGKEIYEGDIYKAKMHVVKTGRTIESIEVVKDIRGDNVYYYDEVEVIGNIYEHPHLLEENKCSEKNDM